MNLVLISLFLTTSFGHALVGLPNESCKVIREEALEMREEAVTGVFAGDTEVSASMDCGGHVPWDKGSEALSAYWIRCADIYDQIYKKNCDLP